VARISHSFGRRISAIVLVLLFALPAGYAYWECWLKVDNGTKEYRKYHDDFSLITTQSYGIPDWEKGDAKAVLTKVYKSGSLSEDYIVVQHMSVLSNMQIQSTNKGTNGGAVFLFYSGGLGYQHYAARFKFRSGYSYCQSVASMCVKAIQTGTGKIYTNNVCWEYGGDPYEPPQSPTHNLLTASKYFNIVEP
jgi:hypothetical protein